MEFFQKFLKQNSNRARTYSTESNTIEIDSLSTQGILLVCISGYDSPARIAQDMYLIGFHNASNDCKIAKILSGNTDIKISNAALKGGKIALVFSQDFVMVRVLAQTE